MDKFKVIRTSIEGLYIIEPKIFSDSRGYFMESYNVNDLKKLNIDTNFVQDNESCSTRGVLRGMHFQSKHSQAKLVRVVKGEVYDVVVDIREQSHTFGKWESVILSSENKRQLYIPQGFAHGFLVLSDDAIFQYKCTEYYYPEYECGIRWNDPDIGIQWPLQEIDNIILSDKDKKLLSFSAYVKNKEND